MIRAIAVAVVAGMFALSGCSASSAQLGRNEAIFVCKQVQHAEKVNPNDPHEVAEEVVFFAGDAAAAAGKHDPRWKSLWASVSALASWLRANSVTVTVTGAPTSPSPVPGLQRLKASCVDPIHPVAPTTYNAAMTHGRRPKADARAELTWNRSYLISSRLDGNPGPPR